MNKDNHKGIHEPLSYGIIQKMVQSIFPGDTVFLDTVSNEGSSVIGTIIYYIFLVMFGRSIKPEQFSYKGSVHGDALHDAAKIIRIVMYFFVNTFISVFFKDIELQH